MTSARGWESLPFDRAFRDLTAGSPRVEQRHYRESGTLPVVDQGRAEIAGYVDDIALACRAPLPCLVFGDHTRIVKYVDHPFAIGAQGVRVLVPIPTLNPRFAYHALRRVRFPPDTGYTRHSRFLRRSRVAFPPLAEQLRIAAMLDKADSIRRKRRESLRLLDEFLSSAFLEMFGDPVSNEKGWEVVVLGSVARETQYGTSAKANTDGTGIPVLRMNNITTTGCMDLSQLKWCEITPRDLPKYTVRRGDLLFNRTNSPELVGKTAVWDRDDAYAFAGYLVRVRFDDSRVLPDYVSGYLNSSYGKQVLFQKAKASNNMSNISASELMRLQIPVPRLDLQRQYVGILVITRQAAERVLAGASAGDSLFDALAQRAFRGEQ